MRTPFLPAVSALTLAAALTAAPLGAQEGLRIGVALGGTGLVGLVGEWRWEDHGVELLLSTFTFRDVGISLVGKQYFGGSWLKPTVGAGFWLATGRTPDGSGQALIARFPLGGDWRAAHGHYATFEVNVNRGLWVNRPDPSDDAPIRNRMIPIPSLSYRWDPR
jgi:hypothetical protein